MINPKQVCERIRNARKEKNYTREQFAEELNISASAYSKIESGQTAITIERLNEIAALLETTSEALLLESLTIEQEEGFVSVTQFNDRMEKVEKMLHIIVKEVNQLKRRFDK